MVGGRTIHLALLLALAGGCESEQGAKIDGGATDGGVTDGARRDAGPIPDMPPPKTSPLPSSIALGGETGPLVVADLDGDGYHDVAAIVAPLAPGGWDLVVAWGDAQGKLDTTSSLPLPGAWPTDPNGRADVRDLPSSVLDHGHFLAGEPRPQLITAGGLAVIGADRSLSWRPLPQAAAQLGAPARLATLSGTKTIIRGTQDGLVERCDSLTTCAPLSGQTARSCAGKGVVCITSDLELADFDGDGQPDVVAGVRAWDIGEETTRLWLSSQGWQSPIPLQIDAGDFEVGDVDGDGRDDLLAQRHETISDFPSHTDVWLSALDAAGAPTPFVLHQTLYNWDNHNDNAALGDVDGDGCLDYVMTGVDAGSGYKLGAKTSDGGSARCTGFIGLHDPTSQIDSGGWTALDARGSIGVQIADLNADGKLEALIRNSEYGSQASPTDSIFVVPLP